MRRIICFLAAFIIFFGSNILYAVENLVVSAFFPALQGDYDTLKTSADTSLGTGPEGCVAIGPVAALPLPAGDKLVVRGGDMVVEADGNPISINSGTLRLRDSGNNHYWGLTMRGTDYLTKPNYFLLTYFDGATERQAISIDPANSHIGFGTQDPTAPISVRVGADTGGEALANCSLGGAWIDYVPCFKKEKEGLKELDISGYVDKLKRLQMYSYKAKADIHGRKIEVIGEDGRKAWRYPDKVINPNARTYIGYCLDDPTTPDEIIARDRDGNISGLSPFQNSIFLMAATKELITRVKALEAKMNGGAPKRHALKGERDSTKPFVNP